MAVTSTTTVPTDLFDDDFDPFGPVDVERIHPKWTTTPGELARSGCLSYDPTADTFFVKPKGAYRGGVAVLVGDEQITRYAVTDMDTDVVVALMVEGFLIRAVRQVPALFDELERAELRGITIEEIRELRHQVAAEGHGPGLTLAEFYAPDAWAEAADSADSP